MDIDFEEWRALVDKGLGGKAFETLRQHTPQGVTIDPLYTERPSNPPEPTCPPYVRGATAAPFRICMRLEAGGPIADELSGGTEALWLEHQDDSAIATAIEGGLTVVREGSVQELQVDDPLIYSEHVWSSFDWLGALAETSNSPLPTIVERASSNSNPPRCIRITSLPFHDAGADPADELALLLSSLVAALRHLEEAKVDLECVEQMLWAQVAIGRDTFGELCKLRALRLLWFKVLTAAGAPAARLDAIHAVCARRTLSARDPWVNMLRVTTQVFAAVLGGAQLVTPLPYDSALSSRSPLGQRVARNTALVLREESQLGRVLDAAGGSYYIESYTDALSREAWKRFSAIEKEGGVLELLRSGVLKQRLEAAWQARLVALSTRKEPVLGVSEFANLSEPSADTSAAVPGLQRDAEPFETLRSRVENGPRHVALITLGSAAEFRARVGYAQNVFGTAGLAAEPRDIGPDIDIACICGSDERYASEAAATVRALKSAGARRVVLAGRPGALEAELRGAGIDAFIFMGCNVLATLEEVLV